MRVDTRNAHTCLFIWRNIIPVSEGFNGELIVDSADAEECIIYKDGITIRIELRLTCTFVTGTKIDIADEMVYF